MLAIEWNTANILIFSIPLAIVFIGAIVWVTAIRGTMLTRFDARRLLRRNDSSLGDGDIMIVYNWTGKIVYVPTIIASLACGVIVLLKNGGMFGDASWPGWLSVAWLAVFALNFLMEEYDLSIKVILIVTLAMLAAGLWLSRFEWLSPFLTWVGDHLRFELSGAGYMILGGIFALTVLISWIRGVFNYVVFTPNVMILKSGLTEGSELIQREKYDVKINTSDFVERIFGFGRIVIMFSDTRRLPISLLVWRINEKSNKIDHIRSVLAVDRTQANLSESSNQTSAGDDAAV